MRKQGHIARHFSLVELLVVVVIILIILGISAPAFRSMTTGNSVDAAARMISSQLMLARAEAISRRAYIAVVLPGEKFTQPNNIADNFKFQSFRSGQVEPDTGNRYKLKKWVEDTQWNFLPNGAVIARVEKDKSEAIDFQADTDNNKYEPKGNFTFGQSNDICEVVDGAGKLAENQTNSDEVRAVVFKPNGRCMNNAVITICEGVVPPGENEPQRHQKSNVRVLKVDQYTGQVRFLY